MTDYIIFPDGTQVYVAPANTVSYTLAELQNFVGGYIQLLQMDNDYLMVINEEGKLKGLARNEQATTLVKHTLFEGDYIVGTVLVCDTAHIE